MASLAYNRYIPIIKEKYAMKTQEEVTRARTQAQAKYDKSHTTDYSGSPAHLGRSSAQLDRASAHLMQSAVQPMLAAVQHTS